ncbi:MAG: KilA-N domain-containing protein [Coleofasciculus sp. C3-bin4]|nr:KilA-N domain-containing protein [Coleofasciculus sp. C3-bin4]
MGELLNFRRFVNGINVDQRVDSGFINGTAMCVAHNKDFTQWFRTKDTFELFSALAESLGVTIIFNPVDLQNLDYSRLSASRYAGIFPGLVFSKRGSPATEGGIWLHPDLALQLAQWCSKPFAIQVSRWIREWLTTGYVTVNSDAEQEYVQWRQRYDIRIELKDVLRPELMNAVVRWAQAAGANPQKLCSEVHDTMNERIQGAKSHEIRVLGGLPMAVLIRDYFDAAPLVGYAAINKLATNAIQDRGMEPIAAVHQACDYYLGKAYVPKLVPLSENIYVQGQ